MSDMYRASARSYFPDNAKLSDDQVDQMVATSTPLQRVGIPSDVARVVAFLCSDDAVWLTGEIITASGGSQYVDTVSPIH